MTTLRLPKPEVIARALYTPNSLGILHFSQALDEKLARELLVHAQQVVYRKATAKISSGDIVVSQNFELVYTGSTLPAFIQLQNTFQTLYAEVGKKADFVESSNVQVGYHHYSSNGYISVHQDMPLFSNLIAVVSLEGKAQFDAGPAVDKLTHHFTLRPRDVVLMRAPRSEHEFSARPFHAVRTTSREDRYVAIFRQIHSWPDPRYDNDTMIGAQK